MVYVASEVGVLGDVLSNAENIVAKGRLGPGQMVCADLTEGEHCCPAGVRALGQEGEAWKGGWKMSNVQHPAAPHSRLRLLLLPAPTSGRHLPHQHRDCPRCGHPRALRRLAQVVRPQAV